MSSHVKQALVFFAITLFLSFFVFWGPIAYFKIPTVNLVEGPVGPWWAIALFVIGGFVPSVTGLILARLYDGKGAVKELFRQALKIKLGFSNYAFIIIIAVYFAIALPLLYKITGGSFDYTQFLVQLPAFLPLIILGPLSEEFGWRGFALGKLLNKVHPNTASLLIGIAWSLWHLPLFYIVGSSQYEFDIPFIVFLATVTSTSFIYTYFYIKTGRSLFSAIIIHWLYTYVIQVVYSTITRTTLFNWLEFIPSFVTALVFVIVMWRWKPSPTVPRRGGHDREAGMN